MGESDNRDNGRRKQQRVDAIEHATVAWQDSSRILHARAALHRRFAQVAQLSRRVGGRGERAELKIRMTSQQAQ